MRPPDGRAAAPADESLRRAIDPALLPRHVGVIMDGNGRWARARRLSRIAGHRAGAQVVRDTVEGAVEIGLEALTLYAFSIENWKRPRLEVQVLLGLLRDYLRSELSTMLEQGIRFRVLGHWRELPTALVKAIERCQRETCDGPGMRLSVAVNYSGRSEIVDACRRLIADWSAGERTAIDDEAVASRLSTAGLPDVELLIRTSGERRLSNFMLWQLAGAELWFTDRYWPDFSRRDLFLALLDFQQRRRPRAGRFRSAPAPRVEGLRRYHPTASS